MARYKKHSRFTCRTRGRFLIKTYFILLSSPNFLSMGYKRLPIKTRHENKHFHILFIPAAIILLSSPNSLSIGYQRLPIKTRHENKHFHILFIPAATVSPLPAVLSTLFWLVRSGWQFRLKIRKRKG